MEITDRTIYSAGPDEVFAILSDPEFVDAKVATMSIDGYQADVGTDGERVLISTSRTLPTDALPDYAKSYVGQYLTLVEEQSWGPPAADGSREATIRLRVDGTPVSLRGRIQLSANGSESIQQVRATLVAKIPLFGSMIEKAAAPAVLAGIAHEAKLVELSAVLEVSTADA